METVEGSGRPPRREAPANRKYLRPGDPIPALQFGQHGELTPRTIKAAGLSPEEEKRAFEMLEVQAAYLTILDCLDNPVDPDGTVHSLAAIPATRLAIAWTLALCGFRQTGNRYIEKRRGMWADPRTPDTGPPPPPPAGPQPGEGWHTPPTITTEHVPRGQP